jgi:signal peptidase I
LVNLVAYRWTDPRRGDIVAIRGAGNALVYLKRILGLPGETVAFARGQLHINGHPVAEPYVLFAGAWGRPPVRLGPGEYYVAGDNRDMPWEEHLAGTVQRRNIAGALLW